MKKILTCLLLIAPFILATTARAQNASDYYGGWIAEDNDGRHIFYIVLRDNVVTGFYCHDCEDPANLAFIDDGTYFPLNFADGLSFNLYHTPQNAAPYQEAVTAILDNGRLAITRRPANGSNPITMTLQRGEPAPNAAPPPDPATQVNPRPNLSRTDWVLPGPAATINPASVAGLWLWGSGPGKQLFMFKQHKDGLRGMVCGPCDNPANMGPLEQISWSGTTLHFEIVHEDNGFGYLDYGPFSNVVDAQIAKHEMHMDVITSYNPPDSPVIEMTLLGPIRD